MFKLPDFPSVDFSKFDLDALRKFDVPGVDVSKFTDAVRDAAYLTVGVGIAAMEQAREITDAARVRVSGLIRNAA